MTQQSSAAAKSRRQCYFFFYLLAICAPYELRTYLRWPGPSRTNTQFTFLTFFPLFCHFSGSDEALCMVNAALVSSATKLSQGCVVVLGKTNMFRFNDPSEAASMRLNRTKTAVAGGGGVPGGGAATKVLTNQSLLSQSLSDLRLSGRLRANYDLDQKLHSSEGNIPENGVIGGGGGVNLNDTPSAADKCNNIKDDDKENANTILPEDDSSTIDTNDSFYSHQPQATGTPKRASKDEDLSKMHLDRSFMSGSPPSSGAGSGSGGGGAPTEEMTDLYKCIGEQKDVIMTCLESETCDIVTLNKQISVLKNMQDHYSKLEYELTRNLWITSHNSSEMSEDNLKSFDEQFSTLVEQEVDRRLFQVSPTTQLRLDLSFLFRSRHFIVNYILVVRCANF